LDKALVDALGLDSLPFEDSIKIIEDQLNNIDKIRERLSSLLDDYTKQSNICDIQKWYNQCSDTLSHKIVLTMEDDIEFGFNFKYRNRDFRCLVSYDDNKEPYWGVCGLTENINSCPNIFNALKQLVLQSNKGFHNYEYNSSEWVISDYERKELIVDRFITLANLIYCSESCSIVEC